MPAATRRRRLPDWLKLPVTLLLLVTLLVLGDWLWRWDQLLYDVHLRQWSAPAPDDIVLVAIDETSLRELGRWPWPRRVHARLIDALSGAGAKAIGLDIVFAEPDPSDPAGDAALARAIRANGRIVLPVMVEQPRLGGQLFETLPLPSLASAAAALGHVHIELDPDGIARSTYLFEGLGAPHWPHFSQALLQVAGQARHLPYDGDDGVANASPHLWVRTQHTLIPYLGPPGHFARISYAQVLKGEYDAAALRDKIVLVGVSATGLGDVLPTPVSGLGQAMPGIEINANILAALRQGNAVEPMDRPGRLLLSLIIALLPALLLPLLRPRTALLTTVALILATLLLSLVLLRGWFIWFPPTAVLFTLAASYPLWSWRRLEETLTYLDQELARLRSEPDLLQHQQDAQLEQGMDFIKRFVPLTGWRLFDPARRLRFHWGEQTESASTVWKNIDTENGVWRLAINPAHGTQLDDPHSAALIKLARQLIAPAAKNAADSIELIQGRVDEVKEATERLRAMRRFIGDSLAQMADGVIVSDHLGRIVLFNPQAAAYLEGDANSDLSGHALLPLLERLHIQEASSNWDDNISAVLFGQQRLQVQVHTQQKRDLLLQLTGLAASDHRLDGLIVTLADITPLKESERKRSELLAFLSHDLRSPMVSLLTYAELVRIGARSADPEALMQQIQHYANKTLTLADDFIHLSRAESLTEVAMQEIDFCALAASALDQVWPQANLKQIRLQSRIPEHEIWLRGERGLLERALINLLNNAVKYSPAGSQVEISVERTDQRLHCCISDTGYGIAAADIPLLFKRFKRIQREEHKDESGTGLGLAFVKTVIDNHGGNIEVESGLGKGSRFCVQLPLSEEHQTEGNPRSGA